MGVRVGAGVGTGVGVGGSVGVGVLIGVGVGVGAGVGVGVGAGVGVDVGGVVGDGVPCVVLVPAPFWRSTWTLPQASLPARSVTQSRSVRDPFWSDALVEIFTVSVSLIRWIRSIPCD